MYSPSVGSPSCLHTTVAALSSHESSHTCTVDIIGTVQNTKLHIHMYNYIIMYIHIYIYKSCICSHKRKKQGKAKQMHTIRTVKLYVLALFLSYINTNILPYLDFGWYIKCTCNWSGPSNYGLYSYISILNQ